MKYINTLEVYEKLIASGASDAHARAQTTILENSFTAVYEDFKDTFASNKLVSIMGGIILLALSGIGGELWYLSKEVSTLSRDMQEVRQYLFTKR